VPEPKRFEVISKKEIAFIGTTLFGAFKSYKKQIGIISVDR
jgi:hypothetical protein